jgi:hypothetical protein
MEVPIPGGGQSRFSLKTEGYCSAGNAVSSAGWQRVPRIIRNNTFTQMSRIWHGYVIFHG